MEFTKTNATLKSSPIPILFIPFNQNDCKCGVCGNKYFKTLLFKQRYCRNCLLRYVADIYLDVHINSQHEVRSPTQSIHELGKDSFFKQVPTNSLAHHDDNFSY